MAASKPSVSNRRETIREWDHSTHEKFYDYYARESQSQKSRDRFGALRDMILRVLKEHTGEVSILDVADIGCGAGTLCMLWAELGHRVHGLDINEPLLSLARERAKELGYNIDFRVSSAAELPWPDNSMDVCVVPELLEHVAEWEACLREFARILRPSGILLLTTSNKLCPMQQEFNLPLYSWYPAIVKRYFERLAVTTRPELANFARYPAVNWFSFYGLRTILAGLGFDCMDRFDVIDLTAKGAVARFIIRAIRIVPLCRFLAHTATPSTTVVAIKRT
jgi:2-polyprenyl-6-hydroxyphenyl methylase/3-demethylubiquinone-9 3-methyltransferase